MELDIFSETARMRVLALFLSGKVEQEYVNEAARKAGISKGACSLALRGLMKAGLLKARKAGNSVFYFLDRENPLARRLSADWLVQQLLAHRQAYECEEYQSVALFGSGASGKLGAKSDVDLLIITNAPKEKVHGRLSGMEKALGREVSPVVLGLASWQRMAEKGERFYKEAIANHVLLYGSELV